MPYYVGLLSAAELYGAAPQAVMVTQLMVPKTRRAVRVGRHQLIFMERAHVSEMPIRWYETSNGRFKMSTPELTAVELVSRQQMPGGMPWVFEVLQGLMADLSGERLTIALDAVHEIPTAQRLGILFARAGQADLANTVGIWLSGKRTRRIPLSPGGAAHAPATLDTQFKVFVPESLQQANS